MWSVLVVSLNIWFFHAFITWLSILYGSKSICCTVFLSRTAQFYFFYLTMKYRFMKNVISLKMTEEVVGRCSIWLRKKRDS